MTLALLHANSGTLAGPIGRLAHLRRAVRLRTLFVPLLLFAWGLGISIANDFGMADESWFLRVSQRVIQGDVLYRDIFYGTTPLSVYLSSVAVRLFGVEILVIKALVTLCFVAAVMLTWNILRQLGVSHWTAGLVGLTLLAYTSPQQSGLYNPLANVWLLGCFSATLSWLHARADDATARRRLGAAGVAAGLCFATKQNLGLYTALALFATVGLTSLKHPGRWRRALWDGGTVLPWFLLSAGAPLLPILITGAWTRFVDYGFTNKRTYLQVADIAYMEGLHRITQLWRHLEPLTLERVRELHTQLAYLLPLLIVPGLLVGALDGVWDKARDWRRTRTTLRYPRPHAYAVAFFVGASFAGVYPRFDYYHVVYAVPCALIGLVWAWRRCSLFRFRVVRALLGVLVLLWAGAGVLAVSSAAISRLRSAEYQWSTIPHFRGVRISRDEHTKIRRYAAHLHDISAAEPTFLLTPYAGFFYLAAGASNPTAFDYPLVTAFGRSGMDEVQRELEEGRISTVCLTLQTWPRLRPAKLEQYVVEHFRQGESLQWCQIYRAPGDAPGR